MSLPRDVADGDDTAGAADGAGAMISAVGLRKSFGEFEAVRGIDVEVRRGEAFGFLGPNGAGKSSTMRMIAAVSPVGSGRLRVLGLDPAVDGPSIRARIGVCPQEDTLDTELDVRDNLYIYGRYFGLPRAEVRLRCEELLDFVQLTDKARSKVEDLSGGMKRRLTIARSLVNRPEVLLLDEPTTGLDPQARHVVWDRLFRLKQQGVTLVLTTHYMDEAEQLCDRLVVMDKGLVVAQGSPSELIRAHSTREVTELRFGVGEHEVLADRLEDLAERVEVLPDRILLYTPRRRGRAGRGPRPRTDPEDGAGPALLPGGRVPPPDRADAGGLMSAPTDVPPRRGTLDGALRLLDYWAVVYRRTWRGSVISSFLVPLLYVLAMGVLLGGFIPGDPARLEGATSYLAFVAPGMVAAHTMTTAIGETTYPVMGMLKWHKIYYSMIATPLTVGDIVLAQLAFITFRVATVSAVFLLVMSAFGVFASPLGVLGAFAVQLLLGLAFATPLFAFSATIRDESPYSLVFRLGMIPLFLFSGAFFPIANLDAPLEALARATPLWHGVDLTRMLVLGRLDAGLALVHVVYLVVLAGLGWWLAVRRLQRRLVGSS